MEKLPPIVMLFHAFPEALLIGVAGLIFVGIRPRSGKAILFGVAHIATAYLISQLPGVTGLHLVLLIVAGSLYLFRLYRLPYSKALGAMFLAFILLLVAESSFESLIVTHTTLTTAIIQAPGNELLQVLVALPQMLTLMIAAYLAYVARGKHVEDYRPVRRYRYSRY
jgi:hypothetical protein